MPIERKVFLEKYRISEEQLKDAKVDWKGLEDIYSDYVARKEEFQNAAQSIVNHLTRHKAVHSLKSRIKDPEHLVEKIVRKCVKDPERTIAPGNYLTEITDLIGVRALHLFKTDWKEIHAEILKTWDLLDGHAPIAYIRKGDDSSMFEKEGCQIAEHERGYRSVHYTITSKPTKTFTICEIQVRTIFEEGWSEVDHRLAYPHSTQDNVIAQYLAIFNVLAGNADQMATFIMQLRDEISAYRSERLAKDSELKDAIAKLEKLQTELKLERGEKVRLENVVESLRSYQQSVPTSTAYLTGYSPGVTFASPSVAGPGATISVPSIGIPLRAEQAVITDSATGAIRIGKVCPYCRTPLPDGAIYVSTYTCGKCGQSISPY